MVLEFHEVRIERGVAYDTHLTSKRVRSDLTIQEVTRPKDLVPAVKPAYGAETARVVLDIVRTFPTFHDQQDFEGLTPRWHGDVCHTTYCVTGWATIVHAGRWTSEYEAQQMLGLSYYDADRLFYTMSEEKAIAALEYVAKDEPIDWIKLDEVYDWVRSES